MDLTGLFGRAVAVIGDATVMLRHRNDGPLPQAVGTAPAIPAAKPQGALPTLKMPTATGWPAGQTPVAAPGLKVNAFATGLKHPRWIHVLPNGDVLAAEALTWSRAACAALFDYAMFSTMQRAAAVGPSPNRITLLRDADGDGVAEMPRDLPRRAEPALRHGAARRHLLRRQHRRRGRLPLRATAPRASPGRAAGSPTSSPAATGRAACCRAPDGTRLYVGVGSLSNIADHGMAAEEGRAAIWELDLASRRRPHLRLRPAQPGGPRLGARRPAACGPWSTSATASATRRRPTI